MSENLKILWVNGKIENIPERIAELRRKLSPEGDIVSPKGRQKTIEIFGEPLTPQEVVKNICADISAKGMDALLDYNHRIDGADLTRETIRVPQSEIESAYQNADPRYLEAIRRIRENIADFQKAILHKDVYVKRPGGWLAERYLPLNRIGICVPGGAAAYPSTLLMTAVPAQVAGVNEIAVMAPPTANGAYNTDLLAALREIGVNEVYRMGGAQGVATLAYGVEGIPSVDKIVGPGNLFVALAKKNVYGSVDIDSIAGPSEVVVIVDESTRADYTAYDLLAQSEHAPGSSILIGWDEAKLREVLSELESRLDKIERGDAARFSLEEYGAVILTKDRDEACRIADLIAPEHLHIATTDAEKLAAKIPHAGAIFLGNYTPVAVGDYAAGPSHVLPTGGTARFASGLTSNDFLRSNSLICFNREGLEMLADDIHLIATLEGLTAHRESVDIRCRQANEASEG